MLFNSLTFLAFFVTVFTLYLLTPAWGPRKALLLAASYLFYAAWNPPYVLILAASTTVDWWLARRIGQSDDPRRRRALLVLSLASNLSLLGFFKYGGFLLANFQQAAGLVGIAYQPPAWHIVLPVGISFYTFASLSYTIDVYRRQVRSDFSLADYALFVSFFPHLVAGPIVRASLLLPQIVQPRQPTRDQIGWGLCLVCFGLFQKAVLADALFAPIVDQIYDDPTRYGLADTAAGVLAFSAQIYYDFAGYSLAAIGLALCFGFEFPDNFRCPYAARGFSDFWRRWHISLSSWLRDYLYIPLGGNRGGELDAARNLLLTMLIGGLWHGAHWMFVMWGGLHGLYLAVERAWNRMRPLALAPDRPALGLTLLTFVLVSLTWIPFRASSIGNALDVLGGLTRWAPSLLDPTHLGLCYTGAVVTLLWQLALRDRSLESVFGTWTTAAQAGTVAAGLIGIFMVSGGNQRAFIYFQF